MIANDKNTSTNHSLLITKNILEIIVDPSTDLSKFPHGICNVISESTKRYIIESDINNYDLDYIVGIMRDACIGWEHYSGNDIYPIDHPIDTSDDGYINERRNLSLYTGEYGRRRLELAQRMIGIIKKRLEPNQLIINIINDYITARSTRDIGICGYLFDEIMSLDFSSIIKSDSDSPTDKTTAKLQFVDDIHDIFKQTMETVCNDWKHYSGVPKFPIYRDDYDCHEAYKIGRERRTMLTGDYGQRRVDLCQLLIAELNSDKTSMSQCDIDVLKQIKSVLVTINPTMQRNRRTGICGLVRNVICDTVPKVQYDIDTYMDKFDNVMMLACDDWEYYNPLNDDGRFPVLHPDFDPNKNDSISIFTLKLDSGEYDYDPSTGERFDMVINHPDFPDGISDSNYFNTNDYYAGEYGRRRIELAQRMVAQIDLLLKGETK